MRLLAGPEVRAHVEERGGGVYIWPRTPRFCCVRTITIQADTAPPPLEGELVHAADGVEVFAAKGLIEPDLLELELDRHADCRPTGTDRPGSANPRAHWCDA